MDLLSLALISNGLAHSRSNGQDVPRGTWGLLGDYYNYNSRENYQPTRTIVLISHSIGMYRFYQLDSLGITKTSRESYQPRTVMGELVEVS